MVSDSICFPLRQISPRRLDWQEKVLRSFLYSKPVFLYDQEVGFGGERNMIDQDFAKADPETRARGEHREGPLARSIEQQTAKLPSDWFLWAAFGSIAGSLMFKMSGKNHEAVFIGQWAPTFLLLGIYNKLVKLHGSDGT
jgi:hypothetical protein